MWTLFFAALAALAQEAPIAFVGARVIPVAGAEIERGAVVVQGGKVVAVGPAATTSIPAGAETRDVAGKVIFPGIVDTHSHIGGGSGADGSVPIQPDVRILDSINARDPGFRRARAGGITTVNVMPGSGHLLSGQTLYLKLREARTIDDLLIRLDGGRIAGGMKMANGTNSQKEPPFPGTRGKSAALMREQLVKAQAYREKLRRAGDDPEKKPDRDLDMEALVEVLDGKRVVHQHTHRHDDILTALRLRDEFGLKMVLHHVSEAWKIAPEIAAAKAPCSVIVIDAPGGKLEARDLSLETGAVLERAGVLVGFHTDDGITDSRLFLRSPALAVRAGMSREKALEAMTIAGAKMLELDSRIGTLEAGKDADLLVLSGDPLSVSTSILETWVEGKKVFDLAKPEDRLVAEGGYGAGVPSMHAGCEGGAP
ncbi:MAG TPA: amidohydrolase family protein [Planctomycetota bacterium]|nr:amidohydrolase family protein [Planctomycetota bacterium]